MVINFHVHMMRFQVDWPRELGEFYIKDMFHGDCWLTGKPWRPEDFFTCGRRQNFWPGSKRWGFIVTRNRR